MKALLIFFVTVVAFTLIAGDVFWKDGVEPDLSRSTSAAVSYPLGTVFESRPYSMAVVDDVPIATTVKGTVLMFR